MAERGPRRGAVPRKSSVETAQYHHGDDIPVWIERLAELCDQEKSQAAAATRIGYSASVVSQILTNRYPGDEESVRQAVERVVGGENISCPVLGDINDAACKEWRTKAARGIVATDRQRVRMHAACRNCGRFKR